MAKKNVGVFSFTCDEGCSIYLIEIFNNKLIKWLENIELKSLDERFVIRGPIKADERVVIVAVDDDSLTEVGRWPWPRDKMAQLTDKIMGEYGAKALGFDIVFSEAQLNPIA